MNDAWKEYEHDFNSMTDEEIEMEVRHEETKLEEAESWLDAVRSWKNAGKPRSPDQTNRQHRTMNIYSSPGTKIIFTAEGGYQGDKDHALEVLEIGKEYTLSETEIDGFHTSIWIEEVPNRSFNSVLFRTATSGGDDD